MTPRLFTPADQNQVATSGNSRQSLQFPINIAAICLFVLDPNHLQVSFLSVIESLLTARNCLHPPDPLADHLADDSDREERWRVLQSSFAIAHIHHCRPF